MDRKLTSRINRRSGIVVIATLLGANVSTTEAKKHKKKKPREVCDPCEWDGQCVKANARCAIAWCNSGQPTCCRDLGDACTNDGQCCRRSASGIMLRCNYGSCVSFF